MVEGRAFRAAMRALSHVWSLPLKKRALDLGLYGQSDYTPFIILGRSRVGSNLLRGLLNAHPHVTAYGEVFRSSESVDWDHIGYFQSRGMQALVQQDPVRFVDAKLLGRYPRAIRAVGFKIFYYHARDGAAAAIWPYLRDRPDVKVIHLKRRNLLRTHVSRRRAALTNRWVNTSGGPDSSVRVRLDYQECLADFEQTRAWEAECDSYFSAHQKLQVEYERLAANHGDECQTIQKFLGVPVRQVNPTTFQQTRQPLSAVIENYVALKEQFGGTAWADFFTE